METTPLYATAQATGLPIALDLVFAVAVWGLVLWASCAWLLHRERGTPRPSHPDAGAGPRTSQPTVRRTNPRNASVVRIAREMTSAERYATAGIVSMDGVRDARRPSLTYTSGLTSTASRNQGMVSNAAHG